MSVFESPRYRQARDQMRGNPIIRVMAAGVAAAPLAEIAGEDGTPFSWLMNQANRAFADAEARNQANPSYQPFPADAPRHIGLVAEAVIACRAEIRAAVASLTTPPGASPESAEVTAAAIWMKAGTLAALAASRPALLLCDGCHEAATGLPAMCEDGCAHGLDHTGLCLRNGPDECQWCGKQDRLREVPLSSVDALLPTAGEEDEGRWHLHFADGAQGPYPSQRAAWDAWHATARPGRAGSRP